MTTNLYEVSAKGDRIPEPSPNSTCKTWKLLTALIEAETAVKAVDAFKVMYAGEYTEILQAVNIVPADPLYAAFKAKKEETDEHLTQH